MAGRRSRGAAGRIFRALGPRGLRLGGLTDVKRIDADRLGDVLELGLAEIADREIDPAFDLAIGAEAGVLLTDLVRIGLNGLASWWKDVEQRPFPDHVAIDILGRQIRRLERLEFMAGEIQSSGISLRFLLRIMTLLIVVASSSNSRRHRHRWQSILYITHQFGHFTQDHDAERGPPPSLERGDR